MLPDEPQSKDPFGFTLPPKTTGLVQPLGENVNQNTNGANPAADIIRDKINNIYRVEPNAKKEAEEAEQAGSRRSKHQQFMHKLSTSGNSLAEIQTAWHNYYLALPDAEKHNVWQEFYANNSRQSHYERARAPVPSQPKNGVTVSNHEVPEHLEIKRPRSNRTPSQIKEQLLGKITSSTKRKLKKKEHLKSLFFGLSVGFTVVLFLMFGFFNERFIAPFITPSRNVSSTPIIIDSTNSAVGPESKIVIPKINVDAPVVYDEPSIEEKAVQKALEKGVLHYATSPNPGELGNGAIFGHSSGNIFNMGQYKFAFILLKSLAKDDVFYLQKDGKRYVYKVIDKKIVRPDEVSVLNSIPGKPATFTLITCDPPGVSTNRLVIVGEQISPDPNSNIASKVNQDEAAKPAVLPSNSPTLWGRIWKWLTI